MFCPTPENLFVAFTIWIIYLDIITQRKREKGKEKRFWKDVNFLILITALFLSGQFIAKNPIQNGEFNEGTSNWIVRWVNSGNGVVVQFIINDEELL